MLLGFLGSQLSWSSDLNWKPLGCLPVKEFWACPTWRASWGRPGRGFHIPSGLRTRGIPLKELDNLVEIQACGLLCQFPATANWTEDGVLRALCQRGTMCYMSVTNLSRCCVCVQCVSVITCWSIPTASRPWYMMLTHPSLEASTNRDIRAWRGDTHKPTRLY